MKKGCYLFSRFPAICQTLPNLKKILDSLALKTKAVVAWMDQREKKLPVTTVEHRTFGMPQWQSVFDTLLRWQGNLTQVKEHVHAIANATMAQ